MGAWFSSSSFLEAGGRNKESDVHLVEVYWRALVNSGVDQRTYPFESAWRDYLLGLVWSFLVVTQVVKFGEPNSVMLKWVTRAAHAMFETEAHEVPFTRL